MQLYPRGSNMKKILLLFCFLCSSVYAQTSQTTSVVLDSFSTGQVSPKLEARQDFPKYNSACRTLENFLISPLGPVHRRPGTKYIATAKTGTPRLLKFEYSTDDVYALETGDNYMRVYRDGGQILEPGGYAAWVTTTAYTVGTLVSNGGSYYRCLIAHTSGTFATDLAAVKWVVTTATDLAYEIVTPFDSSEIWDIRYAQSDNWMYLVDGNDPPQLLTRTGHAAWTINEIDFEKGPFLPENENTSLTITPSGDGSYSGNDYYLTADTGGKIFYGAAWLAQTFTAASSYTASGARLKLYRLGSPGTITVSLRATAGGVPTGADVVSGTTSGDTLTTDSGGEWRTITFSATSALTSATVYALVVRATGASYPGSAVYWRLDSTSPTYTGGSYIHSSDSGSNWTAYTTGDFMFGVTVSGTPSSEVTLTASGDIFDSEHVGALWRLTHPVSAVAVAGTFTTAGIKSPTGTNSSGSATASQTSSTLAVAKNQDFTALTTGFWIGTLVIEKSYDAGVTYRTIYSFIGTGQNNLDYRGTETVDDALYRLKLTDHWGPWFHRDEYYLSFNYTLASVAYQRQGIVKITAYSDANSVTASVLYELGGTSATFEWAEGSWSDYRGWPKTVVFHQQRAIYGGSESYPTQLWFSAIGMEDYNDLSAGALDDDGFSVALQGQNPIRWLLSGDYLLIGTSGSVGKYGMQGKAITPTGPSYLEQSQFGSAEIQALNVADTVMYVERGARKVREFAYALQNDRYTTPDLTLLSEEITDPCIVEITFQSRPQPILWCVLGDGQLATLFYQKDQAVAGWATQITDGNFASAIVTPGSGMTPDGGTTPSGDTWREDEVWTVVERTVNSTDYTFIEQFTPVDWGSDPNYIWMVDCGLQGSDLSAVSNTWTGLTHLIGETVSVYADLHSRDTEVVNASGVIDCGVAYTKIIAGLPFTSKLETLGIKMPAQIADVRTSDKKITALNFDLYESQYLKYGMGANATLVTYDPNDLITSEVTFSRLTFPFGSLKKSTVYVETSQPLALCIRAIVPDITYTRNK